LLKILWARHPRLTQVEAYPNLADKVAAVSVALARL